MTDKSSQSILQLFENNSNYLQTIINQIQQTPCSFRLCLCYSENYTTNNSKHDSELFEEKIFKSRKYRHQSTHEFIAWLFFSPFIVND